MTRGQVQIGLVTAFSAVALFTFGWLGWTSMKTIDTAEQTATIIEWQENTDEKLEKYQNANDQKLEKISDDGVELRVKIETIYAVTSALGYKERIDVQALEKRAREDLENKEKPLFASTTAKVYEQ